MINIAGFIYQSGYLTPEQIAQFEKLLTTKRFKKGTYLVMPDEKPDQFYLVRSGILRNFLVGTDDKVHTKVFHGPNGLLGPYSEFLRKTPTVYYIEAVTECVVDAFSIYDFMDLAKDSMSWQFIQKLMAEASYADKEEREIMLLTMDVQARYERFQERFKPFAHLIPKYMVASYLGATPEGLSRAIK